MLAQWRTMILSSGYTTFINTHRSKKNYRHSFCPNAHQALYPMAHQVYHSIDNIQAIGQKACSPQKTKTRTLRDLRKKFFLPSFFT
jgi:hypothetical protein